MDHTNLVILSALRPSDKLVTIEVGHQHVTCQLSQELLTHHSSYFRSMLSNREATGEVGKVVLSDLEPAAFKFFLYWVRNEQLPPTDQDWFKRPAGMERDVYNLHVSMLHLKTYVVADRLGVEAMRCAVNNLYVDKNFTAPWLVEVMYAYAHIPLHHHIPRMFVHLHVKASITRERVLPGAETQLASRLPNEFLLRVIERYAQLRDNGDRREDEEDIFKCDYHEHATDEEREACLYQEMYELGMV
ncbi:hypothetical protein ACEQ8H_001926 [Pleosporales sp. CAS-2024a]